MDELFKPADIQTPDVENPLEALVGPDKKYKTVEDLAKAALEKDRFIGQLQNETAELRKEVTGKQTIDEIMTQIRSLSKPEVQPNQQPQAPEKTDADSIAELVAKLLDQKESEKRTSGNEQLVSQTLQEKFGADAQLHLTKKAKELNVSLDYLKSVAKSAPAAFFRLIGIEENQKPHQAVPITVRPGSIQPTPQGADVRNKAHYDKIKAQNPAEYFSPKIQNQMYKDAMKLGESFFN